MLRTLRKDQNVWRKRNRNDTDYEERERERERRDRVRAIRKLVRTSTT